MYVRDLEGNEYPIQVATTNDLDLNGNQTLSFQIQPIGPNELFIDDIAEMWEIVDHDDVEHKIVYCKKKGKGKRLTVDVKAIPLFFDKFSSDRIYETYNKHMTAEEFFSILFAGTGFNYVINGTFYAVQWQGLGKGDARINMFKRGLDRYKAEFRLVGNTVYLENQIGRDTHFMYRHRLNASNIVAEIDATGFYTYAKGFGDYEEGKEDEAGLIREYTSPLANIPGIGIRHAPPIYDGRVKDPETMDNALKELVDGSLKISVLADIHDLRKQGYELAQPELGDRVFLIDERIGLNEEVRVNRITIVRNWRGEVIDLKLVLGSETIVKRHQSNLQGVVNRFNEILEGRAKLPFSSLDAAVIDATQALQSVLTELSIPPNGGLMARDKEDPNFVVIFNAAGIGVSTDGGATFRTAMTGQGIVADLITVGTMLFDRIKGGTLTLGGIDNGNGQMIVLNEDGEVIADLDAKTGGFLELYVGRLNSPSIYNVNDVSKTINIDNNIGGILIDIDKINNGSITLVLTRNISENIEIANFLGNGSININLNGYRLDGQILIEGNSPQFVNIRNGTVNAKASGDSSANNAAIRIDRCKYVRLENLKIYGNNSCFRGVYVHAGSAAFIDDCEIYDVTDSAIAAATSAQATVHNCKGMGGNIGVHAFYGGYIYVTGTIPGGGTTDIQEASGEVAGTYTVDYGAATPPAPPDTTKTWTSTSSNNWSSSGYWSNDGVKQGNYGWGRRTGYWFFGSGLSNTVKGKTIKKMRAYVKRANSGGYSSAVTIYIRWHKLTSQPSSAGNMYEMSSEYKTVSLAWGKSAWVELPESFYNAFESGTAKGIGIYVASDSKSNYAVMDGQAKLEITYA